MLRIKKQLLVCVIIMFFANSNPLLANLSCYGVKGIIIKFLKEHYHTRDFDLDFSKRVLEEYINTMDPGKSLFLQKEVDQIIKQNAPILRNKILQGDCSIIKKIYDLFSERDENTLYGY